MSLFSEVITPIVVEGVKQTWPLVEAAAEASSEVFMGWVNDKYENEAKTAAMDKVAKDPNPTIEKIERMPLVPFALWGSVDKFDKQRDLLARMLKPYASSYNVRTSEEDVKKIDKIMYTIASSGTNIEARTEIKAMIQDVFNKWYEDFKVPVLKKLAPDQHYQILEQEARDIVEMMSAFPELYEQAAIDRVVEISSTMLSGTRQLALTRLMNADITDNINEAERLAKANVTLDKAIVARKLALAERTEFHSTVVEEMQPLYEVPKRKTLIKKITGKLTNAVGSIDSDTKIKIAKLSTIGLGILLSAIPFLVIKYMNWRKKAIAFDEMKVKAAMKMPKDIRDFDPKNRPTAEIEKYIVENKLEKSRPYKEYEIDDKSLLKLKNFIKKSGKVDKDSESKIDEVLKKKRISNRDMLELMSLV